MKLIIERAWNDDAEKYRVDKIDMDVYKYGDEKLPNSFTITRNGEEIEIQTYGITNIRIEK